MKFLLYISYEYGIPIMMPIQVEILKRGYQVAWFVEIEQTKTKLKSSEHLLNTVQDVIDFEPAIIFVTSNDVPHFFPGIKVQLFHGFSINKRSKSKGHFRIRGFFDLYCTQGPSTTKQFKKLAKKHQHFKVVETGWPKVDALFPIEVKKNKDKVPTIFVASTFTERLSIAHNNLFYNELEKLIRQENWNWIINLHPKMDAKIVAKFERLNTYQNVTYIPFLENLKPLVKADVMLTDTSSIITEFIIQRKPVVTFKNNKPKKSYININRISQIKQSVEFALKRPKKLIKKIDKLIIKHHPYTDGKSSERVLDAAINFYATNQQALLKNKPLNIVRKYKICKKFKYFKFKI